MESLALQAPRLGVQDVHVLVRALLGAELRPPPGVLQVRGWVGASRGEACPHAHDADEQRTHEHRQGRH